MNTKPITYLALLFALLYMSKRTVYAQVVLDDFSVSDEFKYNFIPVANGADGWNVTSGQLRPNVATSPNHTITAAWLWNQGEKLFAVEDSVSIMLYPDWNHTAQVTGIGLFFAPDANSASGSHSAMVYNAGVGDNIFCVVTETGESCYYPWGVGPLLLTVKMTAQTGNSSSYLATLSGESLTRPFTLEFIADVSSLFFGPAAYNTTNSLAALDNLTFFSPWRQAIETQPSQPTYGTCPDREPGKDSLIVVTHGWNRRGLLDTSPPTDVPWVDSMVNEIKGNLTNRDLNNWQVYSYKWIEKAWTRNPENVLNNAKQECTPLGNCIAAQRWAHVHLIGHSAGVGLIQTASEIIKSNSPSTTIHCTFLDAFVGTDYAGVTNYGKGAAWSDSYFTKDLLTGGETWPFTEGPLDHAYNVDVTYLDPNKPKVDGFISTSSGVSEPCRVTKTSHGWPIDFYSNTITGTVTSEYQGFGFPLSKEGGQWGYATNQYHIGNITPYPLGIPDAPCAEYLYASTPAVIGSVFFSAWPSQQSGLVQNNNTGITLTPQSPAWLATFITVTGTVNFISFDARFISTNGSEGLLSVYWDTNTIGSVDERAVQPGLQRYTFGFPRAVSNSLHVLGFRLDPFTNAPSSVIVTNVSLGLLGPSELFSLVVTTNTSDGLRVFHLTGQVGFNYSVEASTNLVDWATIAVLVNTNGIVRFVDSASTNTTARFYRAVAP